MSKAPAPSPLANAVCEGITGKRQKGFTLFEVMLVAGGLALLSTGSFVIYQGVANNSNVRAEQNNVQQIARNADVIHGSLGNYAGLTTARAVEDNIPPRSMVAGTGIMSKWSQPVMLEPTPIGPRDNAGVRITYEAVPARACLKFAQAAHGGMFDVLVDNTSVMDNGRFNVPAAISLCDNAASAPVAFVYSSGSTGLSANVLPPVSLPPLAPPPPPPPSVAPPTAPPPAPPPPAPPAPGCGSAPALPSPAPPPGQTCSYIWAVASAPTCWTLQPLCSPTSPPVTPPATPTPPSTPPPIITPPPPGVRCSVPPPYTQNGNQSGACPSGQVTSGGSSSFSQSRSRTTTYACPDPFDAPTSSTTPWSPWSPTAASVCSPACSAPAATTESRSPACASGQIGSITEQRTTTWSCPAPTGSAVSSTSPWSQVSNTCAPACVAPAPQTETQTNPQEEARACASGQTGNIYVRRQVTEQRSRSATCSSPTGTASWGGWSGWSVTNVTPWAQFHSTCVTPPPACVAPATEYFPISEARPNQNQTIGCAAGQTGSITQTRTVSENGTHVRTWSCPGPNASGANQWNGTYNYGSWVTTGNSCVTPPPPPPTCAAPIGSAGGPVVERHIVCVVSSNSNWGSWPQPNFNNVIAQHPASGTRFIYLDQGSIRWKCQSLHMNGAISSSMSNDSPAPGWSGNGAWSYTAVRWQGTLYTSVLGEQSTSYDDCTMRGNQVGPGECYLGRSGSMPPGIASFLGVSSPFSVVAGVFNYSC